MIELCIPYREPSPPREPCPGVDVVLRAGGGRWSMKGWPLDGVCGGQDAEGGGG